MLLLFGCFSQILLYVSVFVFLFFCLHPAGCLEIKGKCAVLNFRSGHAPSIADGGGTGSC